MSLHDAEQYGDIYLSIQASSGHYCTPRVDGLGIEEYEEVEIGFLGPPREVEIFGRKHNMRLCHPSAVGIEGFDHLFESGDVPVAGYVSWDDVNRLRQALKERMERKEATKVGSE